MFVVHTTVKVCGSGVPTTYSADIVSARWTNRKMGKWSGRFVRHTGHTFQLPENDNVWGPDVRARADTFSREVAAKIKMAAGPDTFPFFR